MPQSFLKGILPFIDNMSKNQVGAEPEIKKITENGLHDTLATSKVDVQVEGSEPGSITPEEQEELVYNTEF